MDFMGTAVGFAISLFAIAPIVYVVVGVNFWRLRPPKSVNYFFVVYVCVALYSFGYFLEIRAVNESFAFFTRNFQYLGSVFTPTFGLLFIAQNTGTVHPTRRLTAGLCAASGALWLLYVTDPFTGYFYKSIVFSVERYGGTMLTEKNFGFYILFVLLRADAGGVHPNDLLRDAPCDNTQQAQQLPFFTDRFSAALVHLWVHPFRV
jgi:hypothetical protein